MYFPGTANKTYPLLAALAMAMTFPLGACDNSANEAKKQADDKAAQAAKEATLAEEKAANERQEAQLQAAKAARAGTRAELQKQIDAADRKIEYLKDKAGKAKGAVKKNADAALTELDTRHDAATASVKKLDDDATNTWEAAKVQAERDIASLNQSVVSLENTLTTLK